MTLRHPGANRRLKRPQVGRQRSRFLALQVGNAVLIDAQFAVFRKAFTHLRREVMEPLPQLGNKIPASSRYSDLLAVATEAPLTRLPG